MRAMQDIPCSCSANYSSQLRTCSWILQLAKLAQETLLNPLTRIGYGDIVLSGQRRKDTP
jgi:hypothetical protein